MIITKKRFTAAIEELVIKKKINELYFNPNAKRIESRTLGTKEPVRIKIYEIK